MKISVFFPLLCFATMFGYSQNAIKDSAIAYTSDPIKFSYTPVDLISSISVSSAKFTDGEKGIEFFFISKPRQKPPIIRPDSIILVSSTDKILTLNRPYIDSLNFLSNHGLAIIAIHWLDNNELEILKQDFITTIILIVDKKQLVISLTKKTQKQFKELLFTTF